MATKHIAVITITVSLLKCVENIRIVLIRALKSKSFTLKTRGICSGTLHFLFVQILKL